MDTHFYFCIHANPNSSRTAMRRVVTPLLILLIASFPLSSQEQIPHSEVVDAALAHTVSTSQLGLYQQSLLKRLEAFQDILEADTYVVLRKAIENQYAPQKLLDEISRRCAPHLNRPQLITYLKWYESPVGSKISREEQEAIRPASAKEFSTFRAGEAQKHRSQRRRLLLDRLEGHIGTHSILDNTLTSHFRKLLSQSDPQIFGSPGTESVTVRRNMESLLSQVERRHRDDLDMMRLFTYRHVTNNELQMYNEFYQSADGAWLIGLVSRELRGALDNALIQATRDLPSLPGNRPK